MQLSAIWSFIKELFFSRAAVTQFYSRNRLTVLLLISNFIMFVLLMFSMEQATNQHAAAIKASATVTTLQTEATNNARSIAQLELLRYEVSSCENQQSFLAMEYRALTKNLELCNVVANRCKK